MLFVGAEGGGAANAPRRNFCALQEVLLAVEAIYRGLILWGRGTGSQTAHRCTGLTEVARIKQVQCACTDFLGAVRRYLGTFGDGRERTRRSPAPPGGARAGRGGGGAPRAPRRGAGPGRRRAARAFRLGDPAVQAEAMAAR